MGRQKATLPLGSGTFLSRIVGTLREAGVEDIVIVVGHQAEEAMRCVAQMELAARCVVNHDYQSGQFSSLLTGLDAVDAPGIAGALVTLVDVPLVSAATVRAVVEHYHRAHAPIVRPTRGREHGHPVFIDRVLFVAVRAADPNQGAKMVVRAHASPAGDLAVDDDGAFLDIDTPEEYQRVLAERAL
jgi:CTP:molybdopterin cytidylyltransferase MocA